MSHHKKTFVNPFHTKKIFANMKREGKDFSRRVTPLFDSMLVQASEEVGEDSIPPIDSTQIPIIDQPSTSYQPEKKQKSRRKQRKEAEVANDEIEQEENITTPSNDPLPSGEDSMQLNDLMALCTQLQKQVLDLEKAKSDQAIEIASLKKRVDKLEKRRQLRTTGLKRFKKLGTARRVRSSNAGLGAQEDASKQGRNDDEVFVDVTYSEKDKQSIKLDDSTVGEAVSTASVAPIASVEDSAAPTIQFSTADIREVTTAKIDKLTLAQTLIEIKAAKPKVVTTAATTTTTTRPKAKGVVVQEPSEFKVPQDAQPSVAKDKGKGIMIETVGKIDCNRLNTGSITVKSDSDKDANHKFLRSLPSAWSNLAMTMRTNPEIDNLSIDDLYNNLRVFEQEISRIESLMTPVGFDKKKLECFNCHNTGHFARECTAKGTHDGKKKRDSFYQHQEAGKQEKNQMGLLTMDDGIVNWGEHTEDEETNHALMAISSSSEVSLCSKTCIDSYNTLKTLCDEQMNQLGDQEAQILAYSQAVKKLEAQLVTFQKQQLSLNEKLTFQANEIYEKDEKLKKYRRIGMKAVKEKEQLQKTLDSWKDSSKNLWRLINSGMSSSSKIGLGYEIKSNNKVLSYEEEMNFSVFKCTKEDSVGKPLYSRFIKTNDFKGVPHPLSRDYTPKPQEEIDKSLYVYGKKGPQEPEPSVSDDRFSECSTCQSNDSAESIETSSEHSVDLESEISRVPQEVYVSKPITINEKGGNAMMERELGEGYFFTKKKCFICGSLSHLIKDCDYYEKKMARKAAPKKQRVFNTGNGVTKPVWNNADRINHANHFLPRSVILNPGRPNVNSVRPRVNTVQTNINSVRQNVNYVWSNVNTGSFNDNSVRPKQPVPTSTSPNFSSERP
ncbi:ribonuclease H-like domain-containing protein, partial [Tanacetum coccineum]